MILEVDRRIAVSWMECMEQPAVSDLLYSSIRNDRVAHAYLFVGGQGVGKKKLSFQFAKSLFCLQQNGNSCDHCHQCSRVNSGNHPDVHFVAPESSTIKIDQVRELAEGILIPSG